MKKLSESQVQALFQNNNLQYFSKWREDWFDVTKLQIGGESGLRACGYRLREKDTKEEFKY